MTSVECGHNRSAQLLMLFCLLQLDGLKPYRSLQNVCVNEAKRVHTYTMGQIDTKL